MEPLATAITREHGRQLLRLEREELERLRKLYEEARIEIMGRLSEAGVETFTAQHYRGALAQVSEGLLAIRRKLGARWAKRVDGLLEQGVDQTLAEIAVWEPTFRGGATGRIQLAALRHLAEPRALLLEQFQASIATYAEGLRGDIARRLGVHMAKRSPWRDMVLDVAGRLDSALIQGARWKAERIVRTELVDALSTGHQLGLEAAAEELPGLKRQWDAHLDARTSRVCLHLNGQVVGVREPWRFEGREIMRPPALPNCRARVIPWRAEWAEIEEPPAAA